MVAGPPVVRYATFEDVSKEELGGWRTVAGTGSVHIVVDSEAEAASAAKRFLDMVYFEREIAPTRSKGEKEPPHRSPLEWIPKDRNATFDIREMLRESGIVDDSDFLEIGGDYGQSLCTALARVGGNTV